MSGSDFGSDADRHREAASATEVHAKKHPHHARHADHSADAYQHLEHDEATFFTRHRNKLAAAVMVVVATIFFVMVAGIIRW